VGIFGISTLGICSIHNPCTNYVWDIKVF